MFVVIKYAGSDKKHDVIQKLNNNSLGQKDNYVDATHSQGAT